MTTIILSPPLGPNSFGVQDLPLFPVIYKFKIEFQKHMHHSWEKVSSIRVGLVYQAHNAMSQSTIFHSFRGQKNFFWMMLRNMSDY